MPNSRLLIIALLVASPVVASAQFTTFIPPRNPVADSVKAVVVADQKAQADTAVAMRLTNMKTWVDSAAGLAPTSTSAADSLADSLAVNRVATDTTVAAVTSVTADTIPLPNGARAPATASMLPLLVVAGGVLIAFGGLLLRRRRPARERA